MATRVTVTTLGSSTGIVLPKEILSKLRVQKGDTLYLTETPDGVKLTPYEPDFEAKIKAARQVMRRNRNALKRLAE